MNGEFSRAVQALSNPGDVIELRALKNGSTAAGYFDNTEALSKEAAKLDEQGFTVYVTANPTNPALLARAENKIKRPLKATTSDKDVLRRRWLLVDFDPERPSEVSSTDEEKQTALQRAREVYGYLREQGWPEPVAGDSGNGAHLLYPVNLPNDAESLELVKGVLEALSFKFSDERVKVDTTTSNAARIWKLYGTTARKGDSTKDRPHRVSKLLKVPEQRTEVSREKLQAVAVSKPETPKPSRAKPGEYKELDLETWIPEHGVPVKREGLWQQGYRYVLEECPWNGHTDNSAYIVQFPSGGIFAGCQHDSCRTGENRWPELREHYEPGCYDRPDITVGDKTGREHPPIPETVAWPELDDAARYGLPGDVVRTFEPHTEADPVAVLANLICAFGNIIGRGAFARVGTTEHHLKLFVGLVGETAKGRKGESWGPVKKAMEDVDPGWVSERVVGGLSSGEGLIYHVRDEVRGERKGEEVILDPGEPDKRLLAVEGELASVLKVMAREGNTLSPTTRQAWDDNRLRTLTKNSPVKATGAHISIIGHITKAELLRHLSDTEAANGFANRFLWLMVRRSKELPFGGDVPQEELKELSKRLDSAIRFGRQSRSIRWGESAREAWAEVYGPLSEGKAGLFGAVVGRAEAQTLRLAALYAGTDESESIEYEHLAAALALWSYAEESARYIFGDATGDPVADDIAEALRAAGDEGLSRTEIRDLFGRHKGADRINQALGLLQKLGRVHKEDVPTAGRPAERWYAG
jgi:hypothetical protein